MLPHEISAIKIQLTDRTIHNKAYRKRKFHAKGLREDPSWKMRMLRLHPHLFQILRILSLLAASTAIASNFLIVSKSREIPNSCFIFSLKFLTLNCVFLWFIFVGVNNNNVFVILFL